MYQNSIDRYHLALKAVDVVGLVVSETSCIQRIVITLTLDPVARR